MKKFSFEEHGFKVQPLEGKIPVKVLNRRRRMANISDRIDELKEFMFRNDSEESELGALQAELVKLMEDAQ